MAEFFQFVTAGILIGGIYALVALGFSVTFRTTGIVNFAQGEFVMVGGLVTAGLAHNFGVPLGVAAVIALAVAALAGWLLGSGLRRMEGASEFRLVLVTLAYALALQAMALMIFGPDPIRFDSPVGIGVLRLGGVTVVHHGILVVVALSVLVLGLVIFLRRTRWGRAMVATSNDREAALSVGVNVGGVMSWAFIIAALLGAIGGLLLAPVAAISYSAGFLMSLKGFAAAVLGGMANPSGAVAAGLLIGVIESLAAGYISSGYKDSIVMAVLIAVLVLRPGGIFGRKVRAA